MTFLTIDPGVHTGWCALDSAGVVATCGKGETWPVQGVRSAMIECPEIYRAKFMKGDPNNLITLAVRVGRYQERLIAAGVPCGLVLPKVWKGQLDKLIHHRRVFRDLPEVERAAVVRVAKNPWEDKSYSGDVWDAVALAKWSFLARRFAIF